MLVLKPMTIGQLARRTGVSIKVLREYDRLGLIYTLGRSESNYRLFDESALWCVQVIETLRSLGLTLKEIRDIAVVYLERPDEPIGPYLGEKLNNVEARVQARIADLESLNQRIDEFRGHYSAEPAAQTDLASIPSDPRRTTPKSNA